jgi:osmotically-inducible protein OsmY
MKLLGSEISGTVASLADTDRARTLIRSVPGVKRIRSKLGTRWWT